jgi:hypothetical protein
VALSSNATDGWGREELVTRQLGKCKTLYLQDPNTRKERLCLIIVVSQWLIFKAICVETISEHVKKLFCSLAMAAR